MNASEAICSKYLFEDPIYGQEMARIRSNTQENYSYPVPTYPSLQPNMSMKRKLGKIQKYINSLQYNHTGKHFFNTRRDGGMKHLIYTAKVIMREALPIQCVEALFLAVYLTDGIDELLRIPISFKSSVDGNEYSHMILAVKYKSKWGALGISRLKRLMFKEIKYDDLSMMIKEFIKSYNHYWHTVKEVYAGLPFNHAQASDTPLEWRVMRLSMSEGQTWEDYDDVFIQYSKNCLTISHYFEKTGQFPHWCNESYRNVLLTKHTHIHHEIKNIRAIQP